MTHAGDALRSAAGLHIEDQHSPITESDFVTVGNLRYVLPYHFDFRLNAKKRMIGRHPVDVFTDEFPIRSRCAAQEARDRHQQNFVWPKGRFAVQHGPSTGPHTGLCATANVICSASLATIWQLFACAL